MPINLILESDDETKLSALRRDIAAGLDQLDRGESAILDVEDIKAEARSRTS
jgi:hypothetical protein